MPALTVTAPAGWQVGGRDPLDDRLGRDARAFLVAAGQQDRELVAAEPERLAALAQVRRQLGKHLVAGRVAEAVVDLLEVVDVHEAEAERVALRLRVGELALEPVVEVPVVAELRQRVGEREPHRAQLTEGRALVERDREQRADEGRREERRALPEDHEHQRRRRHQRERHAVTVDARPRRPFMNGLRELIADDEADQEQVDARRRRRRRRGPARRRDRPPSPRSGAIAAPETAAAIDITAAL